MIRPVATNADYAGVARLIVACEWSPRDPALLRRACEGSRLALVAIRESDIVGFVRVVGDNTEAAIVYDLLVHPEERRRGLGRALLAVCRWSCAPVPLSCFAAPESESYYARLGWKPIQGFLEVL